MASGVVFRARNLKRVMKQYRDMPDVVERAILDVVEWAAPFVQGEAMRLASGELLQVRSGRYRSSIRSKVYPAMLAATAGTKLSYAPQREFGGVIKAKRKAGLAIPTKYAKTKAGRSKRPRDYSDTFFARRKSDGLLILFGRRTPKAKKIMPLFTFHKRVTQEGAFVFREAFDNTRPWIANQMDRRVSHAVRKHVASAAQ